VIQSDEPLDLTLGEGREIPPEDAGSFAYCFGCRTCTTVCPVVAAYDDPAEVLGLLPHQIMCAMGLGLTEVASGARMIWDCVTCYQCQEHCPQKVCVTDVIYELKNMAAERAGAAASEDSPAEAA
jgi:heterodisulfide reductase subunit C